MGINCFWEAISGYDAQFKKIGEQFGPFDLAFLECGQYGKYWPNIHMFPRTDRAGSGGFERGDRLPGSLGPVCIVQSHME